MSLFADDTKTFSDSNISLQSTLGNIYKCLKTRKLGLNPTKCKILKTIKNKPFDPIDLFINKIRYKQLKFLRI